MRTLVLFFLLLPCFASGQTEGVSTWSIYNSFGGGFGEKRLIAQDHINFSWNGLTFGTFARWSARKSWRDVNVSPYVTYDEYKFVNEFALLGGWQWRSMDGDLFYLMAGPIYRNENARWWPNKGSGSTPFIGT